MNKLINTKKNIKFIYLFFLFIIYTCSVSAVGDNFEILNINVWSKLKSEELKQKADSFYQSQEHLDSAMVLYTILSNRYEHVKNNPKEVKISIESMTKLGILYDMYIHNYTKSYAYYSRALPLSKEYGLKENQAHTTICMAVMYMSLSAINIKDKYSEKAIQLLKQAYWKALEAKSWNYALLAVNNMMICAYSHNMFNLIKNEMDSMLKLPIPSNNEHYTSTKYLYHSFLALHEKRYSDALIYIENYKKGKNNTNNYMLCNYYSVVAETYYLMGKYDMALENMEQIRKLITANDKHALMQINME